VNRGGRDKRLMRIAVGGVLAFLAIVVFAFAKNLPFFPHGHRIDVVFSSSNQLRSDSPVRIAGVTVGKVAGFKNGPGNARTVELDLQDKAFPLHADAHAKIRPRLFLEGGFYVQLQPGSPSAPQLPDHGTIPLRNTAVPVQTNDVLGLLDRPTRGSLRNGIGELDTALKGGGAKGLRDAAPAMAPALRDGSVAADAIRGEREHDLSDALRSSSQITATLAARDQKLAQLVTDLNTATGALAAQQRPLSDSIGQLDALARETPATLDVVDHTLPSLTRFTSATRPSLRMAPPVLTDVNALLGQVRAAASPAELPRLMDETSPTVRLLPGLEQRLETLFGKVTPVTDCVRDRVAPVLEAKLDDGDLSTGRPVWQDLVHALVGAASATGFDGNGSWLRLIGMTSERSVAVGTKLPSGDTLFGVAPLPIAGTRPRPLSPGTLPPLRPNATCRDQAPQNLKAETGPAPPQQTPVRLQPTPPASAIRRALRSLARRAGR
jgi:phospholipid/cholesterol/gamma-HCH transport system substrate-binding protein